jgi:putative hydrolase of the HAD superfamily
VRFDAVFFDVGNTLILPEPSVAQVCAEVLLAAGHERELSAIERILPVADEYYEQRYREDDSFWTSDDGAADVWVGMYALLCRRLGIADSEACGLGRAVYGEFGSPSRWRPYADVPGEFRRLRAAGVKVGIVSNWDTRLAGVLDGIGLGELVDTVVCSAVEGLHKPDPRIFELACARLGVDAARSAHVGDHMYADVAGARAAGMTAVLIDRHSAVAPAAGTGVARIATLDELEGALT